MTRLHAALREGYGLNASKQSRESALLYEQPAA